MCIQSAKVIIILVIFLISCNVENTGEDNQDLYPGNNSPELTEAEKQSLIQDFYDNYNVRCVDQVISFSGSLLPGFGTEKSFGPPTGQGEFAGSLDIFNIGENGEAIFEVKGYVLENGPNPDFKVFENGFSVSRDTSLFAWDLGTVEVSPDLVNWYGFSPAHDNKDLSEKTPGKINLIGMNPVSVNFINNAIDPRSDEAGGDAFDLDDARLITDRRDGNPLNFVYGNTLSEDNFDRIRYVKVVDGGSFLPDDQVFSNGIDIDAICFFNF